MEALAASSIRSIGVFAVLLIGSMAVPDVAASEWEGLREGELLQVADGTRVIFTVQATRPDGRPWDKESNSAPKVALPDPTVCIELGQSEICMPKPWYAPVPHGRTTWFVNTLADSFELPGSVGWSEHFRVTVLDSELPFEGRLAAARGGGREVMGRGICEFGAPCTLTDPQSGSEIGELIVLPRGNAVGTWKQTYLDRCIEPNSMLTYEWLNAYQAMYPNETLPLVDRLSYLQFIRLHERRAIEPLVGLVLEVAVEIFPGFNDGRIRGRHVWDIANEVFEARDDPTITPAAREKVEQVLSALNRRLLQSEIAMAAFGCS